MPSQKQLKWSELRVGITVIAASLTLGFLLFLMSGTSGLFTKRIVVKAYFDNAEGLRIGAPVRLNGVDIGNVTKISIVSSRDKQLTPVEMSMKISTRQVDGVTILDLSGRITLGEGSVQLRNAVRELLGKGSKDILLNLADVNYIDSSGIGELVSAFTATRNQGGELKLLKLTKKVHDLLQITKLYTVFDVQDDEAQAIASFNHK